MHSPKGGLSEGVFDSQENACVHEPHLMETTLF